jgi:hypothetical protein
VSPILNIFDTHRERGEESEREKPFREHGYNKKPNGSQKCPKSEPGFGAILEILEMKDVGANGIRPFVAQYGSMPLTPTQNKSA